MVSVGLSVASSTGCADVVLPSDVSDAAPVVHQQRYALDARVRELRYVDYRSEYADAGCPSYPLFEKGSNAPAGAWVGSYLFDPTQLGPRYRPKYYAPARLRGYCVFQWQASPKFPDAFLPFEQTELGRSNTAQLADTPVVSALEPVTVSRPNAMFDDASMVADLRSIANERWGLEAYADERLRKYAREPVHIALIDNGPFGTQGERAPVDAPHVRSVANVVRAFVCPEGEASADGVCVSELSAHLALPQVRTDQTDYENGGYFGTRGQVAVAIWDAVTANDAAGTRAVLNLSLGWVASSKGLSAPDLAVQDALAFARCSGHLAVAAAGNRARLHDSAPGPLFPAAFERVAAPTPEQCKAWFDLGVDLDDNKTGYEPLVFAAGALDAEDRPIAATREAGRPALAAYGFLISAPDTLPSSYMYQVPPLTGSSMAAGAVSGAAAAIWSVAPKLSAGEVMQVLYETGVDLGTSSGEGRTDFELSTARARRPTVHRISVCRALARVLGEAEQNCKRTIEAYVGSMATAPASTSAVVPIGTATLLSTSAVDTWSASSAWDSVHAPQVGRQPTSPGCSTCRLLNANSASPWQASDLALQVSLNASIAMIPSLQIRLTTSSAGMTQTYAVEPPTMGAADFMVIVPSGGSVDLATLSFIEASADGTHETLDQILVQ
jgi:hypothetical protein